jgi:glutathione S-transferase
VGQPGDHRISREKAGRERFWPEDDAARGMARSMAAEMHSSFAALRRKHSMNVRQIYEPQANPDDDVKQDIVRIMELWAEARARFGGDGQFLFGEFGAADIMYAPVITRIITYQLPVARFAEPYMRRGDHHPFMQDWIAGAQEEEWVIEKFEQPQGV